MCYLKKYINTHMKKKTCQSIREKQCKIHRSASKISHSMSIDCSIKFLCSLQENIGKLFVQIPGKKTEFCQSIAKSNCKIHGRF